MAAAGVSGCTYVHIRRLLVAHIVQRLRGGHGQECRPPPCAQAKRTSGNRQHQKQQEPEEAVAGTGPGVVRLVHVHVAMRRRQQRQVKVP
jgi:hypothetical protein